MENEKRRKAWVTNGMWLMNWDLGFLSVIFLWSNGYNLSLLGSGHWQIPRILWHVSLALCYPESRSHLLTRKAAYNDYTMVKSGARFQVIFCPAGRSTNLLQTKENPYCDRVRKIPDSSCQSRVTWSELTEQPFWPKARNGRGSIYQLV